MKEVQPTWPQTLVIAGLGAAFLLCCYLLSRFGGVWGGVSWMLLAFVVLIGTVFLGAIFIFYLRPRYGLSAFPIFLVFLLGHLIIAAVIWKMGAAG